jgi:hypothetical protein
MRFPSNRCMTRKSAPFSSMWVAAVGSAKTIQINLGGMMAAKPQGSFVKIPGATKIRILFFYPSTAWKKKTTSQKNFT